ncbi:MAG: hypothetical protein KA004_17310 [Verrucomicrobiales bacterium]|nr:hypothetical protein [Verrucomicrobiales bacterium]
MNQDRLIAFFVRVYCLSWAFDFRGAEDGGSLVQYLFFAVTVGAAAVVMVLGFRSLLVRPGGWMFLIWGLYLASTSAVARINHVEPGWYLRNSMQPLLVLLSMGVTLVAAGRGLSWRVVLVPMLIAGVVNVIWRSLYSLVVVGVSIEKVRVEMLSQCLPFLLAFLFTALALRVRGLFWPLVVGGIGIASYVLSVTRSAIFIILAELAACVLAWWKARALGVLPRDFRQRKLTHLCIGGAGLVGILGLLAVAAPFVFERWTERLFYSVGSEYTSTDPSALTRFAETQAFADLMLAEPASFIYGLGLGHPYYWDESYIPELVYTYGDPNELRTFCADIRFPGHSIWTYALFSGGIVGLCFYLVLFFGSTVMAWRSARLLAAVPRFPVDVAFLPFVAMIGFLSLSFTFNPFIERASSIALGVVIAFPQFLVMQAWEARRTAVYRPVVLEGRLVTG